MFCTFLRDFQGGVAEGKDFRAYAIDLMIDSSAFNDIIKDFLKAALQNAGADEEMTGKVMNELRWLFSEKTAKEICEK